MKTVSEVFIFYVSIHTCLFRKVVCSRVWATKMWGRGIICTSLEINQIFPICFECVHLRSCVTTFKGKSEQTTQMPTTTTTENTSHFTDSSFFSYGNYDLVLIELSQIKNTEVSYITITNKICLRYIFACAGDVIQQGDSLMPNKQFQIKQKSKWIQ